MKKLSYIMFMFVLIFLFLLDTSAECTYQERLDLLNEAKKVDVFFELGEEKKKINGVDPNDGTPTSIEITDEYFKMNFANITDNISVKVINSDTNESFIVNKSDLINGIYEYRINNVSNIITYKFEYYSKLSNCNDEKLSFTKSIKKPKLNSIHHYMICSNEVVSDNKYCKRVIDTDFNKSDSEIIDYLNNVINKYNENNQKDVQSDKTFFDLLKEYWYVPVISVIILLISVISIFIIKKRGELR